MITIDVKRSIVSIFDFFECQQVKNINFIGSGEYAERTDYSHFLFATPLTQIITLIFGVLKEKPELGV